MGVNVGPIQAIGVGGAPSSCPAMVPPCTASARMWLPTFGKMTTSYCCEIALAAIAMKTPNARYFISSARCYYYYHVEEPFPLSFHILDPPGLSQFSDPGMRRMRSRLAISFCGYPKIQ